MNQTQLATQQQPESSPKVSPGKATTVLRGAIFGWRVNRAKSSSRDCVKSITVLSVDCEAKIDLYLKDTALVDEEDGPLAWWQKHAKHYPTLARLARKWHCCVATSKECSLWVESL